MTTDSADRKRPRRPRRWPVTIVAALLTALAGLVVITEARLVGDWVERDDLDSFYSQPSDALTGDPGGLIKSEPLLGVPFDTQAWRIMYRSTDLHGEPVVATGIVVAPLTPAPAGGRTIVSWGHPTTGSAEECAPSRGFDPFIGIEGLRVLLDRGYAVVATDYPGMGTEGPDSYLIGETGGHSILDGVRAAHGIEQAGASSNVILWGHSQGGQAVLFAAESASDYAPELHIRAVAAAAPAADLTALIKTHLDDVSGVTIGSYAFTAYSRVYADRGADLEVILTPGAISIQPQMNELCLLTHLGELHEIAEPVVGHFVKSDPTKTEPWATLLEENSAGGSAFDAPLLIVQGLKDELVRPADTEDYVKRAESLGIDVTYRTVSFATHGTIAYLGLADLVEFLDGVGV